MGTSEGATQLRYNFYPKVEELKEVKTDQIRCGEHTDYGAITVLFQDSIGGLEVSKRGPTERRSVTSCYHGSKISGSQRWGAQVMMTATATRTAKRNRSISAKEQPCTCIMLFCTFLGCRCTKSCDMKPPNFTLPLYGVQGEHNTKTFFFFLT